jgi:phosphoribosylamine--glycine ligase
LNELEIKWKSGNSACVVLAAENYPQKPRVGDVIFGLEKTEQYEDVVVFHAGTALNESGKPVTSGGRVLGVTATAESLEKALEKAYLAASEINFEGMQFRRDIGR